MDGSPRMHDSLRRPNRKAKADFFKLWTEMPEICQQCDKESEIPFFVSYCSQTSSTLCLDCRAWYGAISKSVDPADLSANERSTRAKSFLRKVLRSWTVYAKTASATPKQVEQQAPEVICLVETRLFESFHDELDSGSIIHKHRAAGGELIKKEDGRGTNDEQESNDSSIFNADDSDHEREGIARAIARHYPRPDSGRPDLSKRRRVSRRTKIVALDSSPQSSLRGKRLSAQEARANIFRTADRHQSTEPDEGTANQEVSYQEESSDDSAPIIERRQRKAQKQDTWVPSLLKGEREDDQTSSTAPAAAIVSEEQPLVADQLPRPSDVHDQERVQPVDCQTMDIDSPQPHQDLPSDTDHATEPSDPRRGNREKLHHFHNQVQNLQAAAEWNSHILDEPLDGPGSKTVQSLLDEMVEVEDVIRKASEEVPPRLFKRIVETTLQPAMELLRHARGWLVRERGQTARSMEQYENAIHHRD